MIEYEYSFKVESPKQYIDYCEKNDYKKTSSSQTRVLYTSENHILARLTTEKINNKISTYLDFKDENNDDNKILKSSRETIPLKVTNKNKQSIESILDILGYKIHKTLKRKRLTYELNDVKFEIDEYIEPEKCFVVAIEGEKNKVDKIYSSFNNK